MQQRQIKFRFWGKASQTVSPSYVLSEVVADRNFVDLFAHDVVIPMQFTGLKDKNGKEIYEGDVVVVSDFDDPFEVGMNWMSWGLRRISSGWWIDMRRSPCIEVIGNIYENPELVANQDKRAA